MAWPERVGLGVAAIVALFISLLFAVAVLSGGVGSTDWGLVATRVFEVELVIALPVWLLARILAFMIG